MITGLSKRISKIISKNTTRKKESARRIGGFHANGSNPYPLLSINKSGVSQDPAFVFSVAERYSSGWNIGSQEGSMMGFWSKSFSVLAGMYFRSTTRRNM